MYGTLLEIKRNMSLTNRSDHHYSTTANKAGYISPRGFSCELFSIAVLPRQAIEKSKLFSIQMGGGFTKTLAPLLEIYPPPGGVHHPYDGDFLRVLEINYIQ